MSEPSGVPRAFGAKYAERPQYPVDGPVAAKLGDEPESRGRAGLYVGLLWLYVLVLALGTVGEFLGIQWILDLPIY